MFTASGAFSGSLALGENGTLYAASDDGFVYAIDSSGSLQWKFQSGPLYAAPSLGEDGTIYIANRDEHIFAINPRSGTQQWAAGGGPYADKHITWRGGAVDSNYFYTPFRGSMRGIRRTTGALDWIAGEGFEVAGSASILPTGLVVFPSAGRVDITNSGGIVVWRYPVMDPPLTVDLLLENRGHAPLGNFWLDSGIAVGADGTLYMAAGGSRFVAIGPNGVLKWVAQPKKSSTNWASPVVAADGTIYFACGSGLLYALNPDGSVKWTLETNGPISATPVLAEDGTIYVLNSAALLAVSAEGKLIAKAPFTGGGNSSPTLAPDGTLYAASRTGEIVAFSTTHGPLMNSPWPKFQHDLANSGRAPRL
jgi:outer membrane protein assembly factor BamB